MEVGPPQILGPKMSAFKRKFRLHRLRTAAARKRGEILEKKLKQLVKLLQYLGYPLITFGEIRFGDI